LTGSHESAIIKWDLEQICVYTWLPNSTAFRVIVNLLQGQYLTEIEKGYWLGLKMLRFGALVEEKPDLTQQARPFFMRLRDQVSETVHLAVCDDELRVVYYVSILSPKSLKNKSQGAL